MQNRTESIDLTCEKPVIDLTLEEAKVNVKLEKSKINAKLEEAEIDFFLEDYEKAKRSYEDISNHPEATATQSLIANLQIARLNNKKLIKNNEYVNFDHFEHSINTIEEKLIKKIEEEKMIKKTDFSVAGDLYLLGLYYQYKNKPKKVQKFTTVVVLYYIQEAIANLKSDNIQLDTTLIIRLSHLLNNGVLSDKESKDNIKTVKQVSEIVELYATRANRSDESNYEKVLFKLNEIIAKHGFLEGQYNLGRLSESDDGDEDESLNESKKTPEYYYRETLKINSKHPEALYRLGILFINNSFDQENVDSEKEGLDLLSQAYQQGHDLALTSMINHYKDKIDIEKADEQEIVELAKCLMYGKEGATRNLDIAMKLLETLTSSNAKYELAKVWMLKYADNKLDIYFAKAINLLEMAEENGHPKAGNALSQLLAIADALDKDLSWFLKDDDQEKYKPFSSSLKELEKVNKLFFELSEVKAKAQAKEIYKKVADCYESAAKNKSSEAHFHLAACYETGRGRTVDEKEVNKHYKEAIELFNKEIKEGPSVAGVAHFYLAICYETGKGVTAIDQEQANKHYEEAKKRGYRPNYIDFHLRSKDKLSQDKLLQDKVEKATYPVEYYLKAAEEGHPQAQLALAHIYKENGGSDLEKAKIWYKNAAIGSFVFPNQEIEYQLGVQFEKTSSNAQALFWYQRAADFNSLPAKLKLASDYFKSNQVERYAQAVLWLEEGMQKDKLDSHLMYLLAKCYQYGTGTKENPEEAFRLYSRLSSQFEHVEATLRIANCYYKGIGVKQDSTMALKWYQSVDKAWKQNNSGEKQVLRKLIAELESCSEGEKDIRKDINIISCEFELIEKNNPIRLKLQEQELIKTANSCFKSKKYMDAFLYYTEAASKNDQNLLVDDLATSLNSLASHPTVVMPLLKIIKNYLLARQPGPGKIQEAIPQAIFKLIDRTASFKNKELELTLSDLYYELSFHCQQTDVQIFYCEQSLLHGDLPEGNVEYRLSELYLKTNDKTKVPNLIRTAAEKGHAEACYERGLSFLGESNKIKNDGVLDVTKAFELFKKAAEKGSSNATRKLLDQSGGSTSSSNSSSINSVSQRQFNGGLEIKLVDLGDFSQRQGSFTGYAFIQQKNFPIEQVKQITRNMSVNHSIERGRLNHPDASLEINKGKKRSRSPSSVEVIEIEKSSKIHKYK